jgi:hypothetical protein
MTTSIIVTYGSMIPRVSCQSDLNIRNIGIIISRVIVAFSTPR